MWVRGVPYSEDTKMGSGKFPGLSLSDLLCDRMEYLFVSKLIQRCVRI